MTAIISPCGLYRYRLEREIFSEGCTIAGIMVNPSTADASINDQTIKKWIGFCTRWKAKKFIIGNKFAFRATDVDALDSATDPIGSDNDMHVEQIMRDADFHIVAWGSLAKLPPHLRNRWRDVVEISEKVGCKLHCFGACYDGHPLHPVMLSYETQLFEWRIP